MVVEKQLKVCMSGKDVGRGGFFSGEFYESNACQFTD
jgi:hypothetical protein